MKELFDPRNWFGSTDDETTRVDHDSYEERVEHECNHEYGEWEDVDHPTIFPVLTHDTIYAPPRLEHGHLVFDIIVEKQRFCTFCGDRQQRLVADEKGALPLTFRLDEGRTIGDAMRERVDDGDDETAPVIEDESDEPGRVIVNENHDDAIFVESEAVADDDPVKAGGATD